LNAVFEIEEIQPPVEEGEEEDEENATGAVLSSRKIPDSEEART